MKNYALKTKLTIVTMTAMMLSACGALSATTITEDFEGASGSTPPANWALIQTAAGTYSTTTGRIGNGGTIDGGSGPSVTPGTYLINDGMLGFDLRQTITGTFDVKLTVTGNYDSGGFMFGDILGGVSGVAGELLSTTFNSQNFGNDNNVIRNGAGDIISNVSKTKFGNGTWYQIAISWVPSAGLTGVYTVTRKDYPGLSTTYTLTTANDFTFDDVIAYFAFGDIDSAGASFDNIALTGTVFTAESVPPQVSSITNDCGGAATTFNPFTYSVTFDEDVKASSVSVGDFSNSATNSPASIMVDAVVATSLSNFVVTVTPTSTGNIILGVSSNVLDFSGNTMAADADDDETVTVSLDVTPPVVTSIVSDRDASLNISTNTPVTYTITFDAPMNGGTVETTDFGNASNSTFTVDSVSIVDTNTFTVVVRPTSPGYFQLQLLADSVEDATGNTNSVVANDIEVLTVLAIATDSGTWNADSDGEWGDPEKWLSLQIAYGTDSTATFPNNLSFSRTVTLDRDITIGSIDFQETGQDLTISGTQTLTLDVTSGAPDISVSNRTLTISSVIAGTDGLAKSGAGTLTLSGNNTFTNDITIGGGGLTFTTLNTWGGSGKNVTFTGSGTLISTADGYSGGTITVNSGTATYAGGNATFSTATGSGTLVYSTTTNGKLLNIGNASSLTGILKLKYNGNLNYGGNIAMLFSSLGDGADSLLQFESGGSDSGQGVAIAFNGTEAMTFNNRQVQFLPRTTSNWSLRDLILKNNSADSAAKWVINTALNNRSCRNHNFVLGGSNTNDNEFAGVIGNSTNGVYYSTQTGILSLQKVDAGRWILSGANTYSGTTTISGGTLVLSGEDSIVDTGTVNIAGGKLEIATREKVDVLLLNGVASVPATGIWGSSTSGAENQNDTYFTGNGLLYVGVDFPPSGTVLIVR